MTQGSGSGFSVSRQALISARDAAETASRSISSAAKVKLANTTPGVISAHPGWKSSAALRTCLEAWETRIRQLSAQVDLINKNLGYTLASYNTAEEKTVGGIQGMAAKQTGETA